MTAERLITYMLASTSNPMVIIAPADVEALSASLEPSEALIVRLTT